MAVEYEIVDVWMGDFPTRLMFDNFFKERYDEAGNLPTSDFAASMNEISINHDFLERKFRSKSVSVAKLIRLHSYSESYLKEVVRVASERDLQKGNASVLVWGKQVASPVSIRGDEYQLHYIGRFACSSRVPDWLKDIIRDANKGD